MVAIEISYGRSGSIIEKESRRETTEEMEEYLISLVNEMKMAGISSSISFVDSETGFLKVNGKNVTDILDGLEIKVPELEPGTSPAPITSFERSSNDWDVSIMEDIPDLLMKNAISKAYSEYLAGKK